ncbi:S41 family peptidase [Sabulibacter ruber]|uniref:S41 family peptidase n=1 Tax=Sabulibacter ruber TaxID=2811901 RepID=UPI001A95E2B6|nr:S41 family peptidase [Sabulibacter ruber]
MKRILLLFLCLPALNVLAQPALTENQKLESLSKIWGFLKYYHPEVAKGKRDWDAELMAKIPQVKKARNQQELSKLYDSWVASLGKVKRCGSCDNNIPDSLMRNISFGWLQDASTFTPEFSQKLEYIRQNRNQGRNYYVQRRYKLFKTQAYFPNEKLYEKLPELPTEEFRLLSLFRYWNIINYFFPYKYAIGESWDNVLTDMLPKFRNAATPLEYHMALLELSNRINDGHNFFYTKYRYEYFGSYHVPFQFKIVEGKALVTGFYHRNFAANDGIQLGDVITRVNGKTIEEALKPNLKYISGSNYSYKLSRVQNELFNGHTSTLTVTFEKDGVEQTREIRRYYFARFGYKPDSASVKGKPWRMLNSEVGYIHMGDLVAKDVNTAMKDVWNAKGIILDLRHYPKPISHAVAAHLKAERSHYALMTYPDLTYPGVFRPNYPWKAGNKNKKDYYKGKVVLLVNEGTMSAGEFATMAQQTAPNVTTIGSQTAGADGNIVYIPLPGGLKASMSGLGVYYPDGRETQRIGIVPDIEVKPSIQGVREGKDEVLDAAIQFITAGK